MIALFTASILSLPIIGTVRLADQDISTGHQQEGGLGTPLTVYHVIGRFNY
jgi:hypothetical protein